MVSRRAGHVARSGMSFVLALLLSSCWASRPLPTEADVPEAMLFRYPDAEVLSQGSLEASDDDYIDTGGSHEPLEVNATYRLPAPVSRQKIFDWMLDRAEEIGLEKCGRRDTIRDSNTTIAWAACDTEAFTGYRGEVRLVFFDEEASSTDGKASEYVVTVYLHAW